MTDPFSTLPSQIVPPAAMVSAGRYRLPNRNGSEHKGGWTRATNLASAISDTKALGDHEVRVVLLGIREELSRYVSAEELSGSALEPLLELDIEAMSPADIRTALTPLAEVFKRLGKGDVGSIRGNLAHQMVEGHHAGLPQSAGVFPETLAKLPAYVRRLEEHRLVALPGMQERQIMCESLDAVGTLDNILRDLTVVCVSCGGRGTSMDESTGGRCWDCRGGGFLPMESDCIADLKTQKRFWSWLEISCQLALYAHGDAMWDPIGAKWVAMPPVNQELALVMWMPWEHPSGEHDVDIYEVDIARGWEALQTAHAAYNLRAKAKAKGAPWGWVRTAPAPSELERYGARLRDCATRAEASAVYAEATAAGVWGAELEAVAREILPRLTA